MSETKGDANWEADQEFIKAQESKLKPSPDIQKLEIEKLKAERDDYREALTYYADFAQKARLIFDNETDSRAEVYEKYSEYSIGTLGIKAFECLAKWERFKKESGT